MRSPLETIQVSNSPGKTLQRDIQCFLRGHSASPKSQPPLFSIAHPTTLAEAHCSTKQRNPELTDIMPQMDLTNIYRAFCPNTQKKYAFFLKPHGTFSKVDHIHSHKTSLKQHKENLNTPTAFHTTIDLKLDFTSRKKRKSTN